MIYFIGGSPRCGKTTLAQLISKRLGISWLATDTLESIISKHVSVRDFDKKFPKSVLRKKTGNSNDVMYTRYTPKQIANAYIKQSESVWKAIETLVTCELYEKRSFVIEGYHVHPNLVKKLEKKYGKKNIKALFLVKTSIKNIIQNSVTYSSSTDWFVKKTKNPKIYSTIAEMILLFSKFFEREAAKHKYKVFKTDGNFKESIRAAEKYLLT